MVLPPLLREVEVHTAAAVVILHRRNSTEVVGVMAGKLAAVAGAEEVEVVTVATEGVAVATAVVVDAEVCFNAIDRTIR